MTTENSICEECGRKFEYYPSCGKGRFCSHECFSTNQQKDDTYVEVTCSWCQHTLTRYWKKARDNNNHFCDQECQWSWREEKLEPSDYPVYSSDGDVICVNCGTEFHIPPSEKKESNYCSRECMSESFSEPEYQPEYGTNWSEERGNALERDNYTCRVCSMTRDEHYETYGFDLDVHHKIPIRQFDDPNNANFPVNLITLCREHHRQIEEIDAVPHNNIVAPSRATT